ncbi:Putative ATP-dependent DNA helicase recG C-terminal [Desulfobacula phenolica]|uniref:Putative ATP-dependent DNA helicase recG C-terminal n=1 Tax=Desulfobacula phenolica TaxID=90732 RepID=A0A1H2DYK6_9BACT|nr:Putative ATP-dependent DNA helicase recG C-terminal [Desulfobacula phenolica]
MFGNLTLKALEKDDYVSSIRNKLLVEAFYLTGDIEKYGTGFIRIRKKLNELKTATCKISETGDFFRVELLDIRSGDLEGISKTPGKMPGKTLVQILKILSREPHLTIPEIAKKIQKSDSATQRAIRKLHEAGFIDRVGSAKAGYWKVLVSQSEIDGNK